jgi:hypothetical protein
MRRTLALSALASLACLGLPTFAAGTAAASVSVSAPHCETGASHIDCDVTAPGAPATVTWTVNGSSYSGPDYTYFGCVPSQAYHVSYGWVSGGVTYTSGITSIRCSSGPWP